jgi:serine/threonine protein kinase
MSAQPPPGLPLAAVEWAGETWDVVRRLGSGKFAVVAEIRCRAPPHALLAAKMIDTSLISPWAQHQLKAEVDVWQTLDHPHVCKLHGSVTVGHHLVLLLELAAGGELFERIMTWADFKEETAARLMRQLLGAVAYLHERGVIHRDLKPENLLLDSDDERASLRIADFGACKRIASRAPQPGSGGCGGGTPYATFATTPCGSLGYAAPEQVRQQMYECQVDVWSAGVVAYVLLSGARPPRSRRTRRACG